jgi:hypothetical protein
MIKSKTQGAKNKVYKPHGTSFYLTQKNKKKTKQNLIMLYSVHIRDTIEGNVLFISSIQIFLKTALSFLRFPY